jgi:hypothetical protein
MAKMSLDSPKDKIFQRLEKSQLHNGKLRSLLGTRDRKIEILEREVIELSNMVHRMRERLGDRADGIVDHLNPSLENFYLQRPWLRQRINNQGKKS